MCKCGSTRTMSIFAKHSDLAGLNIPHLNIEHHGYMPYLENGLGGDDLTLEICMDCGQIQDWEPITDEMVLKCEEFEGHMSDGDDE